jgi:hypothetical protein
VDSLLLGSYLCDDEDVESDRRGYYPSEYLSKIITVLDSAIHR